MTSQHGHRRRSIRLKGYDYSTPGAYFVTICVYNHESRLGTIVDDMVVVNDVGVELDAYVIMPNHMHGVVLLLGDDTIQHIPSLGDVIGWFKTMTTNAYIRGVKAAGWPRFDGHVWQRNYWEHIIRNDRALTNIRRYIELNPQK